MKLLPKKKPAASWRLYIIRCNDGTLYTGITNDLERRIARHNSGTASRYTRSRLPVTLVHTERCRDKSSALKKEYRIKSLTREEKALYITQKQDKITKTVLAARLRKKRKK